MYAALKYRISYSLQNLEYYIVPKCYTMSYIY